MGKFNEQQLKAIECNDKHIVVVAGAGAGKTHTMIHRIKRLVDGGAEPESILVLTFTRAAALEMKERFISLSKGAVISPEFRTFHSFCYHLVLTDADVRLACGYSSVPAIADTADARRILAEAKNQSDFKVSERKMKDRKLMTPKEVYQYEMYKKTLNRLMRAKNLITFDQLSTLVCELFEKNDPSIQMYKEKYKYIVVDEFQDTDNEQFTFISSFKDSNIFVVGDVLQCQPAGTKITLADDSIKCIEDIKVGDYLLTYDRKQGRYIRGRAKITPFTNYVEDIEHHYADKILEIKTSDHTSRYTPEHTTYAKIHYEGNENCYVTYLMSNDAGWWRVGSTKLFLQSQGDMFGPRMRLQSEHGNAVWILGIYENVRDAWLNEQIVAYQYGIPQTTWEHENTKFNADDLTKLYHALGDLKHNAEKCLNHYHRDIDYPLFTKYDTWKHFSKLHLFPIHVGNLIPRFMDVVVPEVFVNNEGYEEYRNTYEQILEINECPGCEVYSMSVSRLHNYVSDGILTHNCIYSFRNADSSIMKGLIDSGEWTVIRLYKNYRSATSICNFANKNTTYADPQYRIELDPFREDSGKVDVECCYQENSYDTLPEDCADDILKELKTRRKGNYALLARSNKEVAALSEFLKQNKIEFVTRCKNDESLRILRCVSDNEYFLNYVSTQLDSEKYSQYLRMVYVDATEDELSYFYEKFRRVPRIKYYMDTVIGIRVVFNDGKLTTYEKIDKILKLLDIKDNIVIDCADDSNRGILQYLIDEITKSTESDIYVGTIHSVKGLEFNNVFLLGVDGASFPLMNEDNHNLYYVGITRAKDYLRVYNYD